MTLSEEVVNRIVQIMQETVQDAYLVQAQFKQMNKTVLSIKVDTDAGITLDQCTAISRALGKWIEFDENFNFPFNLEVSSPGVGQPLLLHRQYKQNIDRRLRVFTMEGEHVEGRLLRVEELEIILDTQPLAEAKGRKKKVRDEVKERTIAFDIIKEAKVII